MRVISGEKKGMNLIGPKDSSARPTEDRIKEAIFNILHIIEPDSIAVDLFACTGSIGLEFLSRGSKRVYFSEINKENIKRLKFNIDKANYQDKSIILEGDFRMNLDLIKENVDYLFLDPPYYNNYIEVVFDLIKDNPYFKDTMIICEVEEEQVSDKSYNYLDEIFSRKYGKKYIKIYKGI